ncbi:hypothetical protein, partial [Proteus mirabilis]
LKVVPTLTKLGTLQFAVPSTFERFGGDGPQQRADTALPDFQADFVPDSSNKLIESLERDSSERGGAEDAPIEQSDNSLVRLINTMII